MPSTPADALPRVQLEAREIDVVRAGTTLARGVSFALQPGDALILRGPNASGKTSLLRMIAGFAPDPSGRLQLRSVDDAQALDPADAVAWSGHADGLRADETPRSHIGFFARWTGGARRIDDALEALGLSHVADRPARRLSAGQKRRLALARVWASNRPLWLLDEPYAPLDDAGRAALSDIAARHRARGGLIVASAHQTLDWPDAEELRLEAKPA